MRQAAFAPRETDTSPFTDTQVFQRTATFPKQMSREISADHPWLNGRVPNGFWDIRENRLSYLNWLGQKCQFIKPDHWYQLRKHHFELNSGGGLLRNAYGSSVQAAMRDFMPHYEWHPWLFGGAPNGYWKVRDHRVRYLTWLGERLQIEQPEQWYKVTAADFFNNNGGGLLNNEFNGSVQAVLIDYIPRHPWKAWLFQSVPQSYWNSSYNRIEYLKWLGQQVGFHSLHDWQQLRREHFLEHQGSGVFVGHYKGSVQKAIAEIAPTLAKT